MKTKFSKHIGLKHLKRIGVPVPQFIVLTPSDVDKILTGEQTFNCPSHSVFENVAVRSSGSISTPGRMKTKLNVRCTKITEAVEEVYQSTQSSRLLDYLELKSCLDFKWSIIVQQMIAIDLRNEFSGTLWTHNPITGQQEIQAEVVEGYSGDAIMSGLSTPLGIEVIREQLPCEYLELLSHVEKIQEDNELRELLGERKEIEFAIKDGKVWLLQVRRLTSVSVLQSDNATDLEQFMFVGQGCSINSSDSVGQVTYDINNCEDKILIIEQTDFDDVKSIIKCKGLVTMIGGQMSHAASIAKDFHITTIVGVGTDIKKHVREHDTVLLHHKGGIFKQNI